MENIQLNWEIRNMEVTINQDGLSKVVNNIEWALVATVEGKPYRAEYFYKTHISSPEPSMFTEYESLTKEQVISWIESVVDIEHIKEYLTAQIEEQANPVTAVLAPPFAN